MFENIHLNTSSNISNENPLHNKSTNSVLTSLLDNNIDTMNNLLINENLDNESIIK